MRFHVTDKRAVGFHDDLVLVAVVDDGPLLAPRVKLQTTVSNPGSTANVWRG